MAVAQRRSFNVSKYYPMLDRKAEMLVRLYGHVPLGVVWHQLEAVWLGSAEALKAKAGCNTWGAVGMFKMTMVCEQNDLWDGPDECEVRDWLSLRHILGVERGTPVPAATMVCQCGEELVQAGVVDEGLSAVDGHLKAQGCLALGGLLIETSIVPVPKQRNEGNENAATKRGETPGGWGNKPGKQRQKDADAAWTNKHDESHYCYPNHIKVDLRRKLIRRDNVTDSATRDIQAIEGIVGAENTVSEVLTDSAYRSAEIEAKLEERELKSRIPLKAHCNRPLTRRGQQSNKLQSKVRGPGRACFQRAAERRAGSAGAQHRNPAPKHGSC